jgi:hypothetical protein
MRAPFLVLGFVRSPAIACALVVGGSSCGDDQPTLAPGGGDAGAIVVPAAAFTIVESGSTHLATSATDPRFVVEVDCDDETADGRYFGISPVLDGTRLEVPMYGGPRFPLFTPDFEAGEIRCVRLESDETRLFVRFEVGSYRMLDPSGPDEPVPLEAAFSIEDGHLVARVSGIYYMMLTKASTTLRIAHGEEDARTITESSSAFTETFDDVTRIEADDSIYGSLSIEAMIARLQLQLYDDGSEGFELDLDHSFKDRGQRSVMATVVFR